MFTEWTQGVDEVAKANLDKPLIVRDPNSLQISVNFDPKVWINCTHNIIYSGTSINETLEPAIFGGKSPRKVIIWGLENLSFTLRFCTTGMALIRCPSYGGSTVHA